ncbi:MAG: 50S ribosomal protein L15 [Patescibacteria group bacterium]|nr:50S ribosomal protein L15 [Patescibacteria group bacterium]
MQIHQLKSLNKRKTKRIGRGGKRGTYSGRGQKGQKSRSGHRIRPAERDLFSKLPKLRGVKNKSLRLKPVVINVGDLEKILDNNSLNKKILIEKGIVKRMSREVKLTGNGEVKKAFTIEDVKVSKTAREKIEKAGGTIK